MPGNIPLNAQGEKRASVGSFQGFWWLFLKVYQIINWMHWQYDWTLVRHENQQICLVIEYLTHYSMKCDWDKKLLWFLDLLTFYEICNYAIWILWGMKWGMKLDSFGMR
eukprot:NODE_1162_length_1960_cov_2.118753.p2 type:complete len:109 gc:universal NODE_1162_length_1960_cov_2.118753:1244-1570(+)